MQRLVAAACAERGKLLKFGAVLALVLVGTLAMRMALSKELASEQAYHAIKAAARGVSDRELVALMEQAGPGALRIAADHNPDKPMPGVWGRPAAWRLLEVKGPPNLGLGHLSMAEAQRINGVIPDANVLNPPTAAFVLHASAPERAEAIKCLTTAIYYEAALEPRQGQEAVAQVVLNRMRHPGFPKSVCGVVFQGSDRPGCQFSFACDGSMAREPAAWAWRNAKDVAEHALDGFVMKDVGTATHYHTSWIMAGWTPTLLKVKQIGGHIFFRPLGPDGQPDAFTERYGGGEVRMSKVSLIGKATLVANAPAALLKVSAPGSTAAPASAVQGGRMVMMPDGTVYLPRIKAAGQDPSQAMPPMHAMIALRAQAAKAAQSQSVVQTTRGPAPAIPSLVDAPIIPLDAAAAG